MIVNTRRHGEITGNFCVLLRLYARTHEGWRVSLGKPDIGVARVDDGVRDRDLDTWMQGAPALVVEVVEDGDSGSQPIKKALDYLDAGARMVWVADPDRMNIMVFTPPNQIRVLGRDETLDGGDVLPGFSCLVSEVFE